MTCDRKIGPFDCCSVVQGDCLELMKQLPDGCVDAVVSDPQYQLACGQKATTMHDTNRRGRHFLGGITIQARDWGKVSGDDEPFDPAPFLCAPIVVLWGANHFANRLPNSRGWLVWDKRDGVVSDDNADCELAWSTLSKPARIHRQLWKGICRAGEENIAVQGEKLHPFQKPVALMLWCIQQIGESAQTILDPFCGSGTTLVAAKKLGRHFLGFELVSEYCRIARDRLARIEAQPSLFAPKIEQTDLFDNSSPSQLDTATAPNHR